MARPIACLWFDPQAEGAAACYVSLLPGLRIRARRAERPLGLAEGQIRWKPDAEETRR